jgi:hypothetical protein
MDMVHPNCWWQLASNFLKTHFINSPTYFFVAFIDDILIYSEFGTKNEHHVRQAHTQKKKKKRQKPAICKDNNNNHSSLLSLWNLKIMKDILRLLSFHLRNRLPIWGQ